MPLLADLVSRNLPKIMLERSRSTLDLREDLTFQQLGNYLPAKLGYFGTQSNLTMCSNEGTCTLPSKSCIIHNHARPESFNAILVRPPGPKSVMRR